jgi:hypothetical protein
MKITDEIRGDFTRVGLNIFNYDVSDICDVEGSDEWIQVDNGNTGRGLEVLYQGPGGQMFKTWRRGFFAGWDYAATLRGQINRK